MTIDGSMLLRFLQSDRSDNAIEASPPFFQFDHHTLQQLAQQHRESYMSASPFPHIVIDNFLPADIADAICDRFPAPDHPCWLDWTKRDVVHQPKKQGIGSAERLAQVDPFIQHMLMVFNAQPFIHFLETLTAHEAMLPDPHLEGGGLHQILPGGILDVHVDFNYQPRTGLYRRTNAILYLNKNWKPEYNGCIELWDKDLTACQKEVAPLFNRLLVFDTDNHSFHGHPKPVACPEGMTRKSLALYHYCAKPRAGQEVPTLTTWQDMVEK